MKWKDLGHIATKAYDGKFLVITTIWPFNFFLDTVKLDEDKLEIVRRGFLTKKLVTVKLVDLFNVEILEAPLFCTVRVIGKYVTGGHEDIPYIRKKDAYELHKRVMALTIDKTNPDQSGGQ